MNEISSEEHTYRNIRYLDDGSVGTVYQAEREDGLAVAMKFIAITRDEKEETAFLNELSRHRAINGSGNPYVVEIIDTFAHHEAQDKMPLGCHILVMPCMSMSLADALDQSAITPEHAVTLLDGLAEGLNAIHAQKMWHGDIKPANVLLQENPEHAGEYFPQWSDFGCWRSTPGYTPHAHMPANNAPLHERICWDAFQFGILAFEVLTGMLPECLQGDVTLNSWQGLNDTDRKLLAQHPDRIVQRILNLLETKDEDQRPRILASWRPQPALQRTHHRSIPLVSPSSPKGKKGGKGHKHPLSFPAEVRQSIYQHPFYALLFTAIGFYLYLALASATMAYFGFALPAAIGCGVVGLLLTAVAGRFFHAYIERKGMILNDIVLYLGVGIIAAVTVCGTLISSKDFKQEICRDFYGQSWLNPFGWHLAHAKCSVKPEQLYSLLDNNPTLSAHLRTKEQKSIYDYGKTASLQLNKGGKQDSWLLLDYIYPPSHGGSNYVVQHQRSLLNYQGTRFNIPVAHTGGDQWVVLATVADAPWPDSVYSGTQDEEDLNRYFARLLHLQENAKLPRSAIATLTLGSESAEAETSTQPHLSEVDSVIQPITPAHADTAPVYGNTPEVHWNETDDIKTLAAIMQQAMPDSSGLRLNVQAAEKILTNDKEVVDIAVDKHQGFSRRKPYAMVDYLFKRRGKTVVEHQSALFNRQFRHFYIANESNRPTHMAVLVWLSDRPWPAYFNTENMKEDAVHVLRRLKHAKSTIQQARAGDFVYLNYD